MDDELGPLLRAVLDEPVVIRVRHDLGPAQARLLDRLGATVVVDPAAPVCDRFCGRQECGVSVRVNDRVRVEPGKGGEIVVMAAWCGKCKGEVMPVGDGDCPWCGSRIVDESQLSARAMLEQLNGRGLEEAAAVGKRAVSGSAPLLVGEPERAAVSSSPEPGPAEPAPTPEGEERRPAGGGASTNGHGNLKWTRENVIAAIREVAEKVGHTPSRKEMLAHGYGAVPQKNVTDRLGTTWSALVREAGYEPLTRADGVQRRAESSGRAARPAPATRQGNTAAHPAESEREPKATDPAEAEVAPSRRPLLAAEATSRSDVLLRAVALAARAFADAILEEA